MNRKTALLILFVLLFGFFANSALMAEIPGGIIALTGNKTFLYYDFTTKQADPPLYDLRKIQVNGPFAVSRDGKTFLWMEDGKFFVRSADDSRNKVINDVRSKTAGKHKTRIPAPKSNPFEAPQNVTHLGLSTNGKKFYYEYLRQESANIIVGGQPVPSPIFVNNRIISAEISGGTDYAQICIRLYDVYGNAAEYLGGSTRDYYGPNLTVPVAGVVSRFAQRRDAHFGVWSNDKDSDDQLFAFIYRTANGWGPIEIRGKYADGKPGIYEIMLLLLKDCQGLAWKPDGSLTLLVAGKVFSFSGQEIKKGIENSGIAPNPNPNFGGIVRREKSFVPVRNVFTIKPEFVADGIGAPFYWVANDVFIFRNENNALCCWDKGNITKLLPKAPERFFYCESPFGPKEEGVKIPANVSTPPEEKTAATNEISGEGKARERTFFKIGSSPLEIIWWNSQHIKFRMSGTADEKDVIIITSVEDIEWLSHRINPFTGEHFELQDQALNVPALYNMSKTGHHWNKFALSPEERKRMKNELFQTGEPFRLNDVIIFINAKDNYCVGLKPIQLHENGQLLEYEWKYFTPDEMKRLKEGKFTEEEKERQKVVAEKSKPKVAEMQAKMHARMEEIKKKRGLR